jgi:hypothetical protein
MTNPGGKLYLAETIYAIDPKATNALEIVLNVARDKTNDLQLAALQALGRFGENARAAMPLYCDAARANDSRTWTLAVSNLFGLGANTLAMRALFAKLADRNPGTRIEAGYIVLQHEPTNFAALSSVAQSLRDEQWLGMFGSSETFRISDPIPEPFNAALWRIATNLDVSNTEQQARAAMITRYFLAPRLTNTQSSVR